MNLKKFNDKYGHTWLLMKSGGINGAKYRLIHFPSQKYSVCLISTIKSAISIVSNNDKLDNKSYLGKDNPERVWKYIRNNLDLFGEVLRHLFFVTNWQEPPTFNIRTNVFFGSDNRYETHIDGIGRVEMKYQHGTLMFEIPDGAILINENCKKNSGWMWTTKEYA